MNTKTELFAIFFLVKPTTSNRPLTLQNAKPPGSRSWLYPRVSCCSLRVCSPGPQYILAVGLEYRDSSCGVMTSLPQHTQRALQALFRTKRCAPQPGRVAGRRAAAPRFVLPRGHRGPGYTQLYLQDGTLSHQWAQTRDGVVLIVRVTTDRRTPDMASGVVVRVTTPATAADNYGARYSKPLQLGDELSIVPATSLKSTACVVHDCARAVPFVDDPGSGNLVVHHTDAPFYVGNTLAQ